MAKRDSLSRHPKSVEVISGDERGIVQNIWSFDVALRNKSPSERREVVLVASIKGLPRVPSSVGISSVDNGIDGARYLPHLL